MRAKAILILVIVLSGCSALMVGGGSGGYKDDRSASVASSDTAITSAIRKKFAADSTVAMFNLGVQTWKGTVNLSGQVNGYAARNRAEQLARATSGVVAVNNEIMVEE